MLELACRPPTGPSRRVKSPGYVLSRFDVCGPVFPHIGDGAATDDAHDGAEVNR